MGQANFTADHPAGLFQGAAAAADRLPGQLPHLCGVNLLLGGYAMIIRIEGWRPVNRRDMEVSPTFTGQIGLHPVRLRGRVFGHPQHRDGSIVSTAPIKSFDSGNVLAEDGLFYELGEILDDYESRYPRAREQLQARIQKHKEKCHVSSEPPSRRIADHR